MSCRFTKAVDTDWHMALVENAGDGEPDAVVVERPGASASTSRRGQGGRLGPWIDTAQAARMSSATWTSSRHKDPTLHPSVAGTVPGSAPYDRILEAFECLEMRAQNGC